MGFFLSFLEEPNLDCEDLDLGKKQPVSFTNEAYEPSTGILHAPPETTKEQDADYSNAEVTENRYAIQTTLNTNKEKTSSDSKEEIEMGTTSYTIQTTPAEAAVKEPNDLYTVSNAMQCSGVVWCGAVW